MIPVWDKLVAMLRECYKVYQLNVWLVQRRDLLEKYSETSLEQACKAYKKLSRHLMIYKHLALFCRRIPQDQLGLYTQNGMVNHSFLLNINELATTLIERANIQLHLKVSL